MIKDVFEEVNDHVKGIFEFGIIFKGEKHLFRAVNGEEMGSWIRMFKKTIAVSRPVEYVIPGFPRTIKSHRKNRESKIIDSLELINRPRLTSSKSDMNPPSIREDLSHY